MAGLYIAADLGALGAAAAELAGAGSASRPASVPSFGHAGADAAAGSFARAAHRHGQALADAAGRAAQVMHGYVVAFREIGD